MKWIEEMVFSAIFYMSILGLLLVGLSILSPRARAADQTIERPQQSSRQLPSKHFNGIPSSGSNYDGTEAKAP